MKAATKTPQSAQLHRPSNQNEKVREEVMDTWGNKSSLFQKTQSPEHMNFNKIGEE
jgi:hypothetical protein